MAYDEDLADRVRAALKRRRGVREIKMFGGLCFTLNGNMCVGIMGDSLMLRLGKEGAADALSERHARPMDFTGRVMSSIVLVDPPGIKTDEALRAWVDRAVAFAKTLPAK